MRSTAHRRSFLALLILLPVACTHGDGRGGVVGFAYTQTAAQYPELARAMLLRGGARAPAILFDSAATEETSERALSFAATLVGRPDVAVVVGPSNSRHALATAPAYNAAHLPQIVPSATNRRLREAGPYTFTLVPDDSVEGDFLARFAWRGLHARRALLLFVNDEYGEGLRAGIVATYAALGGTFSQTVPLGEGMDIPTMLAASIASGRPDVIICAGRSTETAIVLRAARQLAPGVPVIAGDGAYYLPILTATAGPDLSGLYVLSFWVYDSTDPGHRALAEEVRRVLHAEPKPEDALTVDALMLAAAATSAAGNDREGVRRWLAGLGTAHPPFHGLTGEIAFGPERQLPLTMVRFVGGHAVRVPFSLVGSPTEP